MGLGFESLTAHHDDRNSSIRDNVVTNETVTFFIQFDKQRKLCYDRRAFFERGIFMHNKKIINMETKTVYVDVDHTDVEVELGKDKESFLLYHPDLMVEQEDEKLFVHESDMDEDYVTIVTNGDNDVEVSNGDGLVIMIPNEGQIQSEDRKTIMSKGQVFSLNKNKFDKKLKQHVKFVLGQDAKFDFVIATKSGNVQVNELARTDLDITTDTGNIDLIDIDSAITKVDTSRGNVNVTILDTLKNYRTILKTIHGKIQQESFGNTYENGPVKKHVLDVCSKHGDINVVFHSKQK